MIDIKGSAGQSLQPLKEAFASNFRDFSEEGAALAVVKDGKVLASLWAGTRDRAGNLPWLEDTCVNVFSAGKPLCAAVVMHLVDTGRLDLDVPVARYWPEFGSRGKEAVTTRQVLNHTSGLSAFHPRVKEPVIFDIASVNGLLEYETPWWEPGTAQGYSPFIYGWILAEIARRVSGEVDYPTLFSRTLTQPLGMQAYLGVPTSAQGNLADVAPLKKPLGSTGSASKGANSAALGQLMKADPRGVTNRAFANPMSLMNSTNSEAWRGACIPAANLHTNALSLAQFYGDLVSASQPRVSCLSEFTRESSAAQDRVLGVHLRFGLGFMLSQDVDDCRYGSLQGFGHPGAGGSVGFADPATGIGFAYVTARLGQSLLIDARAQRLVQALSECV
ncbi:serine hydrolase domain-containing protein [Gilvimarinus sp. SDUM040013]|uniref:Serine hydrolase domain-containing protein n=1 Tax=Gilvimarinus gilvus TaxID=3058038 RepID=A0ABU4S0U1_9GAMM|nr:serine hydrolase domain-containing protein [Gilvimarinus sp. SDUM040013]MDO3386311.1 serine hydrolase domain-containing protein [Gilvimarinus sp. SDUM040013]MDX6850031.1 serine hydrolase domain-containing protein [Gilvimarinus sp. SDUM040013]